jgi:hypothetical protein
MCFTRHLRTAYVHALAAAHLLALPALPLATPVAAVPSSSTYSLLRGNEAGEQES